MNKNVLNKWFERSMQHNYLIIEGMREQEMEEYVYRMLLDNTIKGILPVTRRLQDGNELYCYQINSMQPIDRLYERQNMSYQDIQILIKSYREAIQFLEEYLLDFQGIILEPDSIYYHAGEKKVKFIYYPYWSVDSKEALCKLTEYILMKTNHADEKAVKTAYQLYKIVREENTTIEDIDALFTYTKEESIKEKSIKEEKIREELPKKEYREDIKREELPFAPDPLEEMNFDKADSKEKNSDVNKKTSFFCMILAFICLMALLAERVFLLYHLEEEYEMLLFAAIVMFAAGGIIFRLIGDKKQLYHKEQTALKLQQNDMIYNEWRELPSGEAAIKSSPVFSDNGREASTELEKINWQGAGETTVIGLSDCQRGNQLKRIDGVEKEEYTLNHFPFLIGRMAQCVDLVLNDSSISKMHARIEEKEGKLFLQDMNSTNGTMKNGILLKLNESTPIQIGDEITFGKMTFRYL